MNTPENRNASGKAGVSVEGLPANDVKQNTHSHINTQWDFPNDYGRGCLMRRPVFLARVSVGSEAMVIHQFERALLKVAVASPERVSAKSVVAIAAELIAVQRRGDASDICLAIAQHGNDACDYARSLTARWRRWFTKQDEFSASWEAARERARKASSLLTVKTAWITTVWDCGATLPADGPELAETLDLIGKVIERAGLPGVRRIPGICGGFCTRTFAVRKSSAEAEYFLDLCQRVQAEGHFPYIPSVDELLAKFKNSGRHQP
jgi:hypothetical protein